MAGRGWGSREGVGEGRVSTPGRGEGGRKGLTLEETLGVLLVELEELTGGTTDLGQDQRNSPDLALVPARTPGIGSLSPPTPRTEKESAPEAVLSSELELRVEASRLERTTGDLRACQSAAWTGFLGEGRELTL